MVNLVHSAMNRTVRTPRHIPSLFHLKSKPGHQAQASKPQSSKSGSLEDRALLPHIQTLPTQTRSGWFSFNHITTTSPQFLSAQQFKYLETLQTPPYM